MKRDELKLKRELEECTFHPTLIPSHQRSTSRGYIYYIYIYVICIISNMYYIHNINI